MKIVILSMVCVLMVIQAQLCFGGGSTLTGTEPVTQTFIRDYDATHTKTVGDVLARIGNFARENNVLTSYSLIQTSINALAPSITSTLSIFNMSSGVLSPVLNILGSKVGIGTASPSYQFQVQNSSNKYLYAYVDAGNIAQFGTPTSHLQLTSSGSIWNQIYGTGDSWSLRQGASNYMMTVLGSGKIGIGTTNPSAKTQIVKNYTDSGGSGNSSPTIFGVYKPDMTLLLSTPENRTANFGGSVGFSNADGFVLAAIKGAAMNSSAEYGGYLGFYTTGWNSGGGTNGYERMRIDQNGNVGIGTTVPSKILTVDVGSSSGNGINLAGTGDQQIFFGDVNGTYSTIYHALNYNTLFLGNNQFYSGLSVSSNNIGIGSWPAQEKLDVVGNERITNGWLRLGALSSPPAAISGYAGLFSVTSGTCELKALDGAGNITQLSSHAEPQNGFDSPEVDPLPWSMNHSNTFIGKGQIVYMSRLVRLIEDMTGQQLSEAYDLPDNWKTEYTAWQKEQVEHLKADYIQKELNRQPTIEVSASEALQNASSEDVTLVQLKSGYLKDEKTGQYLRMRKPDEIIVPTIAPPELPDWIKARLGGSSFAGMKAGLSTKKSSIGLFATNSKAEGQASVVVGGDSNSVIADRAAIVGGHFNGVFAEDSAVLAGVGNQIGGAESVILGGHGNVADGTASIASGISNRTEADLSFVGGRNLDLTKSAAGSFVWDDAQTTKTISTRNAFLIFPSGNGAAAIGTDTITTGTRLEIAGGDIRLTGGSLVVNGSKLVTPDYVFELNYPLPSMDNLREYINQNGHLPGVPSSAEIKRKGLDVARFQMNLLEKIEEQSRYILNQDETVKKQNETLKKQQAQIDELKKQVETLMQRSR